MTKLMTPPNRVAASIVSCDIVGHGTVSEHRQYSNITTINAFVRKTIDQYGMKQVVWASGGDGGHTAFIDDALVDATLRFARALVEWSVRDAVPLRIAVHRGKVALLEGADGRVQLAGTTMNLCGSVVNFGRPGAVIATKDFVDSYKLSAASETDWRATYSSATSEPFTSNTGSRTAYCLCGFLPSTCPCGRQAGQII